MDTRLFLSMSFKLQIEINLFRGWSKIGAKGLLSTPFEKFSMNFMLAVSENIFMELWEIITLMTPVYSCYF